MSSRRASQRSESTPLLQEVPPEPIEADRGVEQQQDAPEEILIDEPSKRKLAAIMASIWLGVFLGALDGTIIATLSTPISNSFNSFTLLSWLASAYFIANAALQPISGRLTDIFGRRAGLVFSNAFFFAGNLICGLAKDEWFMILGRVVAGMGGGGLMAISTFVGSDLVPLRQRGLIQGLGNVCYGLGGGLGGVYGGWINSFAGWRFAFYFQLPLIAISGVLVAFMVKIPVKEKNISRLKRVDFLGAFTLVSTLVLLLVGLNSGGNIVPWSHPVVLATLPLSAVGLLVFIFVENRVASEPVIPVRLLLHRTVACACLTNWFTTMAAFMLLYYAPVYFQILGASPLQAGARLIPQSVGASVGSLGAGYIMRATGRYYILNIFTESLLLISSVLIAGTFDQNTAQVPPYVYFFLMGAGYGGMLTVTLLALIAAVDHKHQAVVTSASYAFRSTGSTIGITIASAVFQNILKSQLWARFGGRPDAEEFIGMLRNSIGEVQNLKGDVYEEAIKAYMWALKGVWFTMLGVATLGVVVSLGMREHTLHKNLARR
ncbi:hypothetical protein FKW77_007509 [Venturia effusa]|uniref:Major facilitator superfamily (MFS) profile domain-containing protein n=1 Tax=Venturia effusa TaxID=50376 RepID=A0A517L9J9_9PEZI|nr:hypothetical protein FKW77_007509 [Venturia effusa]